MAEKNWLIRTKNKQILGPATKQKVIDLIEKGSLTSEDEISCGNGYWFWIRERDLIDKYLYGDLPQSFNPITEAEDVLTAKNTPDGITASVTESPAPKQVREEPSPSDNIIPSDDDLLYPDEADLDYPDMGDIGNSSSEPVLEAHNDAHADIQTEEPIASSHATAEVEVNFDQNSTVEVEVPSPSGAIHQETSDELQAYTEDGENFLYPSEADLEYPETLEVAKEEEAEPEDVTDPNVEIPDLEANEIEMAPAEEVQLHPAPENEPVEAQESEPESEQEPVVKAKSSETTGRHALPKGKSKKKKTKKKKRKLVTERKGNDRYLFIIVFLIVAAIGVVFYYYKEVLNKPFPVLGIHEVHAQSLQSLSKKKS